MDISYGSTSQRRKPRAKSSVFPSDTALTRAELLACNFATATFSVTGARSRLRSRFHNADIRAKFYMKTHFSLIPISLSRLVLLRSDLILMATQNLNWADDSNSRARLQSTTRPA